MNSAVKMAYRYFGMEFLIWNDLSKLRLLRGYGLIWVVSYNILPPLFYTQGQVLRPVDLGRRRQAQKTACLGAGWVGHNPVNLLPHKVRDTILYGLSKHSE